MSNKNKRFGDNLNRAINPSTKFEEQKAGEQKDGDNLSRFGQVVKELEKPLALDLKAIVKSELQQKKELTEYKVSGRIWTDWDRILDQYKKNPQQPKFDGYVVTKEKRNGKTFLVWNNQMREVEE